LTKQLPQATGRFYRSREAFTVYGGPEDWKNPHGLIYVAPGEAFDGGFLAPSVRATLIANGTISYWPEALRD